VKGYFDASVVVPLFLEDAFTARAVALLQTPELTPVISDWAALEVSNVVSRRLRIQALTPREALATLADFDLWRGRSCVGADTSAVDVVTATLFVRRMDLVLRGPDAVHLAIADRVGAVIYTFDDRMALAATALGLAVG